MGIRRRLRKVRWWLHERVWARGLIPVLIRLLPRGFVHADELTSSGRQAVRGTLVGLVGIGLGVLAVLLLDPESWEEVLAGAALAWSVSLVFWARGSFRRERDETESEIRKVAETDLLHARLNKIGSALGIRTLKIDAELQAVIDTRFERLAHFSGLDEYRSGHAHVHGRSEGFWDDDALGHRDDSW